MQDNNDVGIFHVGSRCLLQIGAEEIEVTAYQVQQSGNGKIAITVTIEGNVSELALEASLTE